MRHPVQKEKQHRQGYGVNNKYFVMASEACTGGSDWGDRARILKYV